MFMNVTILADHAKTFLFIILAHHDAPPVHGGRHAALVLAGEGRVVADQVVCWQARARPQVACSNLDISDIYSFMFLEAPML